MTQITNRQVRLQRYPDGIPVPDEFEIVEADVPALADGHVLCRTRFLSLDPYMRSQIAGRHMSGSISPGDMMRGESVCEVVRSQSDEFSPGQTVRCMGGWQEYTSQDAAQLVVVDPAIEPPSYALSLLGMTGLTAWAGMVWQADVTTGDRVLIPAVTGGVGSAAAQFCRNRGATVIGIAGSDEKCQYAVESLGIEACINRKTQDVPKQIDRHFPDGIDVYFDLIGGELLEQVSAKLAINARVVLCGLMAEYNSDTRMQGPPPGYWIRARATVYGLVVYDYESQREEFIQACMPDLVAGKLHQREDVSHGIESAPDAFCRLMNGQNFGKAIVAM